MSECINFYIILMAGKHWIREYIIFVPKIKFRFKVILMDIKFDEWKLE